MPQKAKNYGARYSVPVSHEGAALVDAEMKYHGDKPMGQTLGEILVEGIRARMKDRGLDTSQYPAVRPGETASPGEALVNSPVNPVAQGWSGAIGDGMMDDDRGKQQQSHPSSYLDGAMPQEGADPILSSGVHTSDCP